MSAHVIEAKIKTRWGQVINTKIPKDWSKKKVGAMIDQRMLSKGLAIVEDTFGDSAFIEQIIRAESDMGRAKGTYRKDYYGGVAQIDEAGFKSTQDLTSHPRLEGALNKLKKEHGIDWMAMEWKDLSNPQNSAIAARLFLLNKPDAIPKKLKDRADYWKEHYNTAEGKGTANHFITANGGTPEEEQVGPPEFQDGTYEDKVGNVFKIEKGVIDTNINGNFVDKDGKMRKVQGGK